ncbi:hypothetical protein ELI00_17605 [Rhizobium ruizarguesonis]|nr:hypothetical protein ELI42_17370 [Rhizobium ruizarguesonis]TAU64751.1 hypothetical protein ELI44_17410 [Rhizobium ruizarguesonis]TAX77909.1 hypothetical protein ELI00_17605 [Rhizobium ruizarguesonis]
MCNGVQRNIASQQIFRTCDKLRQAHDISLIIGILSKFLGLWQGFTEGWRRAVSTRDPGLLTVFLNGTRAEIFRMKISSTVEAVPKCDRIKAGLLARGVLKRCRATNSPPESLNEGR